MSKEKVKVTYSLEKAVTSSLEQMSTHTKKDVNILVETALKYFIATHRDFLSQSRTDDDEI